MIDKSNSDYQKLTIILIISIDRLRKFSEHTKYKVKMIQLFKEILKYGNWLSNVTSSITKAFRHINFWFFHKSCERAPWLKQKKTIATLKFSKLLYPPLKFWSLGFPSLSTLSCWTADHHALSFHLYTSNGNSLRSIFIL